MILRIHILIIHRHSHESGNPQIDALLTVAASLMRLSPILLAATLSVWILAACDSEGPASVREGNEAFEAGEYQQAQEAYDRALEAIPESPEATYNSANVFYKQDQFGEARDRYDSGVQTARAELSQRAAYNAGNSLYQSEEYEGAVEAYKQALRLDPTDEDAKHNLELALKRIEEQQQEQENQETAARRPRTGTGGRGKRGAVRVRRGGSATGARTTAPGSGATSRPARGGKASRMNRPKTSSPRKANPAQQSLPPIRGRFRPPE